MEVLMAFVSANSVSLLVAALAVSEVLASVPSIKSNSIFQLVVNVLKSLQTKKPE